MILTRLDAQALTDGLSAAALAASTLAFARQAPGAPLRARLTVAFGALCLFFAARSAAEALDAPALGLTTLMIACGLPLTALMLAEGLLRRHAPAALKALVVLGGAATAFAMVVTAGQPPASSSGLGAYVLISLAAITLLLLGRDRSALSRQENAAIDAALVASALMTLLCITDFVLLAPVGLSGVGAASVAFVLASNPASRREALAVLGDLTATAFAAAVGALVLRAPLGLTNTDQLIRLGSVLFALLLASGALRPLLRAEAEPAARAFIRALARADLSTLDAFLAGLADQPLLAGLRVAEGEGLVDYDAVGLRSAMQARPVWTPAHAGEELADLMARLEATHAMMISPAPLKIALLTLPGAGAGEEVEPVLALFSKLAAAAAGEGSCA